MSASDAIRAREEAKRPKPPPAKKPKPTETGQYERELDKPNHVPGEYVDEPEA